MFNSTHFVVDPKDSLTSNDLGTVLEEVVDISARWYPLGLQLNLKVGTLERIKAQSSDPQEQLMGMLKSWLNSSCHLTWKNLISALRSRSVEANALASDLEKKYGLKKEGMKADDSPPSADKASTAPVPPQLTTQHGVTSGIEPDKEPGTYVQKQ